MDPAALIALVVAVAPNVPGFLAAAFPQTFAGVPGALRSIYDYAWFVGVFVSIAVYLPLMAGEKSRVTRGLQPA